jgi:micrococcal nuclease
MRAAESAKSARRGLWGACPDAVLDPLHAASTGVGGPPVSPPTTSTLPGAGDGNCAASYPGVCIAPPPPDLDCKDVPYHRFAVRWDVPDPDPHRFDGDHDGIGCES